MWTADGRSKLRAKPLQGLRTYPTGFGSDGTDEARGDGGNMVFGDSSADVSGGRYDI